MNRQEFAASAAGLGPDSATFNVAWQTSCATPPDNAKTAFSYAAGLWASAITSTVPIEISACWSTNMPCDGIGCGDTTGYFINFAQAPLADTFYPSALADSLAGANLAPGSEDIDVWFDSSQNWSFKTDSPGSGIDFVSVALHEIGHGLGFTGNMYESYNVGFCGTGSFGALYPCPTAYDRFVVDNEGVFLLDYLGIDPRITGSRLKSDANFGGPNTVNQNGSAAKLYTPLTWDQGSSLSHLDPAHFSGPDGLMIPSGLSYIRTLGPVTLAILQDMGWPLAGGMANLTTAGLKAVAKQTNAVFEADFDWPGHSSLALSYTWKVTDKSAIIHVGRGISDTVSLQWNTTGLKNLSVAASGGGTKAGATRSVLVFSVAASGLNQGDTGQAYTFHADLSPDATSLPVTYRWEATGQSTVTHTGLGAVDSQAFSWNTIGTKSITVTASIGAASFQDARTIQISGTSLDKSFYLPLVLRGN